MLISFQLKVNSLWFVFLREQSDKLFSFLSIVWIYYFVPNDLKSGHSYKFLAQRQKKTPKYFLFCTEKLNILYCLLTFISDRTVLKIKIYTMSLENPSN
jgi:hypothetical protein